MRCFPHFNVEQNVAYGLRQMRPRIGEAEVRRRVAEALAMVRLDGFAARRTHEMSGGQQQRVALARAIVNRPSVLLLDEPLAALDKKLRSAMQIELQTLQRELGITFVLVTHDQEEALSMADQVCVMSAGRIRQLGTPEDVYDHPADLFVADFVGKTNRLSATLEADHATIRLADGSAFARAGKALPCARVRDPGAAPRSNPAGAGGLGRRGRADSACRNSHSPDLSRLRCRICGGRGRSRGFPDHHGSRRAGEQRSCCAREQRSCCARG